MRSVGIQGRSAAKPQLVVQHRAREDLDQGAADDEILLDLPREKARNRSVQVASPVSIA